MEITQEQKMYAQVLQKAWEDAQFKKDLMANPVNAIEQLTGHKINLAQGQTLVVNDQTDDNITYFNIPRKINIDELELTDEQLEMVAGGEVFVTAGAIMAGAAVAATLFGAGVMLYQVTHQK
jgi:hypothetical protein